MRRLALLAALGAIVVALAAAASSRGGDGEGSHYRVELDTAYGLVDGGDLKVAGVRAGVIEHVGLDRRTKHALIDIRIDEHGFGGLRADTRCEVRPQSLLGEYFLDCLPGTSSRQLPDGAIIPVERTTGTVPLDLVTNVLRLPYRERLRLLISSLGAGASGNGHNLNAALRRAVPAVGQTDRVLGILARQERVIDGLVRDADTTLGAVDRRRHDVGRFVQEVGDVATASAQRRNQLRAALRATPGFLAELTPTMRALGDAARRGTPALRSTRRSAGQLQRLLALLTPVSDAARPTLKTLGRAAADGRGAVAPSRARLAELAPSAKGLPEVATNLAIILEHLDNRDFAVEDDKRSPGGKGFTVLEGAMRYALYQALAVNAFDAETHVLNIGAFPAETCGQFTDLDHLKANPQLEKDCGKRVGPIGAGITVPDLTAPAGGAAERRARRTRERRQAVQRRIEGPAARPEPAPAQQPDTKPAPAVPKAPAPGPAGPVLDQLDQLVPDPGKVVPPPARDSDLLDYLLGQ